MLFIGRNKQGKKPNEEKRKTMSTRSWIGMVNKDGTVNASYCHFDGCPSGNGKILLENYTKYNAVRSIACKRCFRSLETQPSEVQVYPDSKEWDCKFESINAFLARCDEDYTYLYKDKKWMFRNWSGKLATLTMKDCKDDE